MPVVWTSTAQPNMACCKRIQIVLSWRTWTVASGSTSELVDDCELTMDCCPIVLGRDGCCRSYMLVLQRSSLKEIAATSTTPLNRGAKLQLLVLTNAKAREEEPRWKKKWGGAGM